jgi:hypothetical protein
MALRPAVGESESVKGAGQRPRPLLSDALPALAAELLQLFRRAGREDLASQILSLRVKSRCRCGDDFCATIYTGAGRPAYSIDLEPAEGMIIVDVASDERVLSIEILYRDEYREAVDALFPLAG